MLGIFFHGVSTKDMHYEALKNDLQKAAGELEDAYRNLSLVVDPDLIDSCIYQVYSVQMRYKFLLTSIKELESVKNTASQPKKMKELQLQQ